MSKKPRSRLRDLAEYAGVRALEVVLRLLPIGLAQWLGRRLGALFRLADRRHRLVAEHNAAWALGLSPEEARQLVRKVYRNFGATFAEGLLIPHILRRKRFADFAHIHGGEHVRAALAKGRGAILVGTHLGNWELGGLACAELADSVMAVARPLDNPLLDRHMRTLREQLGQTIVERRGAMRRVLRHLRAGGLVVMLIDQNQRRGGVFVDFFGKLASTVPTPASIALKHDVPVLAASAWRADSGFVHHFRYDPPFDLIRTGDREADIVANTALFTKRIEESVRSHPDQWFWLHRRWRRRPPEELDPQNLAPTTEDEQEEP